jgi:adenylate cyclase
MDLEIAGPTRSGLDAAFLGEERRGIRLATLARLGALAVIALWLVIRTPEFRVLYHLGYLVLFALLGLGLLFVSTTAAYRPWMKFAFALLETCLLWPALYLPNPLWPEAWPVQLLMRDPSVVYFFVLLGGAALSFSPGLMLWSGGVAAASVVAGVYWTASLPGSTTWTGSMADSGLGRAEHIARFLDPNFVDVPAQIGAAIVLLVVAATLAVVVWRSRRMVRQQVRLETARANLARHFSPNMVDELAASENPLGEVRRQVVAVLFADIFGFTRLCETLAADKLIELLQQFHHRVEHAVFDAHGTIDKYIGDGVMATFGTPRVGERDATNAVSAALTLLRLIDEWNRGRRSIDDPPLRIGIGIHYGPVVLGNVGGGRLLEFSAFGDTVNVASRLQALTRDLDTGVVVSDDVMQRLQAESGDLPEAAFTKLEAVPLRGREQPLTIWSCPAAAIA